MFCFVTIVFNVYSQGNRKCSLVVPAVICTDLLISRVLKINDDDDDENKFLAAPLAQCIKPDC